jgi:hypothetical protein
LLAMEFWAMQMWRMYQRFRGQARSYTSGYDRKSCNTSAAAFVGADEHREAAIAVCRVYRLAQLSFCPEGVGV